MSKGDRPLLEILAGACVVGGLVLLAWMRVRHRHQTLAAPPREPGSTSAHVAYPQSSTTSADAPLSPEAEDAAGTGELLLGPDTEPPEGADDETRPTSPMAKIPGVHVGGGATGTLHAMASGCLDLPGVTLNLLDPVIPAAPSPHTTAP